MQLTDTADFDSALERGAVWFNWRNVEHFASYQNFLRAVKPELGAKLGEITGVRQIEYNLKLETTTFRIFGIAARERVPPAVFSDTDIGTGVDDDFAIMLSEEDAGKGTL